MGDNDFPIAMAGQGGSPYQELDPMMLRRLNQPPTVPSEGFKDFLKQYLPKVPDTKKPTGYLQEEKEGSRTFAQSGTDVPNFQVGQAYEQQEGGPIFEQMFAGGPSFDMAPDIDDPIIDRWLEQERSKPGYVPPKIPTGPELKRRIDNFRQRYGHLLVQNQGPSSPVKYDEGMGGFVPNQGAGRPANIRYKGFPKEA